jgi:hypothetical protein
VVSPHHWRSSRVHSLWFEPAGGTYTRQVSCGANVKEGKTEIRRIAPGLWATEEVIENQVVDKLLGRMYRVFRAQADWLCRQLLRKSYYYNYYILLIINEKNIQCVLAVPSAPQNFSWQVAKGFRKKLPSVKIRSNQPASWTLCVSEWNRISKRIRRENEEQKRKSVCVKAKEEFICKCGL